LKYDSWTIDGCSFAMPIRLSGIDREGACEQLDETKSDAIPDNAVWVDSVDVRLKGLAVEARCIEVPRTSNLVLQ